MEFHMINIIYAALSIRAQTEKTTFSCKDDCTLTKHTWRWTYSAKDFEIPLCHIPPLRSFFAHPLYSQIMCLFICQFINLLICQFMCMFICWFIRLYLSVNLSVYLLMQIPIYLSVAPLSVSLYESLSISLLVSITASLSIYQYACLSVCLYIHISVNPSHTVFIQVNLSVFDKLSQAPAPAQLAGFSLAWHSSAPACSLHFIWQFVSISVSFSLSLSLFVC